MRDEVTYAEQVRAWVTQYLGVLRTRAAIDPEYFGPVKYSMPKE